METSLTQRDKALLLILGIILIVFAAVMIPKFGIYALISSRSETQAAINKQKSENETLYMELVSSGISGAYAESAAMAKNYLEKRLLAEKHNLALLSNSICRQESFDTAKNWVSTMKYKGYVIGEDSYFSSLNLANQVVVPNDTLSLDDVSYNVNKYESPVEVVLSTEIVFNFSLDNCLNVATLNDLAAMLVMSSQAIRRGSCTVTEFNYQKTFEDAAKDKVTVTIAVYTTVNEELSGYASEICECHSCGYAYTLAWYNTQLENGEIEGGVSVVTCPDCQSELDGTTIG